MKNRIVIILLLFAGIGNSISGQILPAKPGNNIKITRYLNDQYKFKYGKTDWTEDELTDSYLSPNDYKNSKMYNDVLHISFSDIDTTSQYTFKIKNNPEGEWSLNLSGDTTDFKLIVDNNPVLHNGDSFTPKNNEFSVIVKALNKNRGHKTLFLEFTPKKNGAVHRRIRVDADIIKIPGKISFVKLDNNDLDFQNQQQAKFILPIDYFGDTKASVTLEPIENVGFNEDDKPFILDKKEYTLIDTNEPSKTLIKLNPDFKGRLQKNEKIKFKVILEGDSKEITLSAVNLPEEYISKTIIKKIIYMLENNQLYVIYGLLAIIVILLLPIISMRRKGNYPMGLLEKLEKEGLVINDNIRESVKKLQKSDWSNTKEIIQLIKEFVRIQKKTESEGPSPNVEGREKESQRPNVDSLLNALKTAGFEIDNTIEEAVNNLNKNNWNNPTEFISLIKNLFKLNYKKLKEPETGTAGPQNIQQPAYNIEDLLKWLKESFKIDDKIEVFFVNNLQKSNWEDQELNKVINSFINLNWEKAEDASKLRKETERYLKDLLEELEKEGFETNDEIKSFVEKLQKGDQLDRQELNKVINSFINLNWKKAEGTNKLLKETERYLKDLVEELEKESFETNDEIKRSVEKLKNGDWSDRQELIHLIKNILKQQKSNFNNELNELNNQLQNKTKELNDKSSELNNANEKISKLEKESGYYKEISTAALGKEYEVGDENYEQGIEVINKTKKFYDANAKPDYIENFLERLKQVYEFAKQVNTGAGDHSLLSKLIDQMLLSEEAKKINPLFDHAKKDEFIFSKLGVDKYENINKEDFADKIVIKGHGYTLLNSLAVIKAYSDSKIQKVANDVNEQIGDKELLEKAYNKYVKMLKDSFGILVDELPVLGETQFDENKFKQSGFSNLVNAYPDINADIEPGIIYDLINIGIKYKDKQARTYVTKA